MVVAQKVKETEITEQDSLLLTRNLLRIAIFNISYIRGLFPEKYFSDKSVPALDIKIKKLMPMDPESRRLIDWMEKGVYDALQKKYLKTLLFCICESIDGPMVEQYSFSFSYSDSDNEEVSLNINRIGSRKGTAFKCNSTTDLTPNQMRSSACKMVRTLVQLMRTLDKMPEERTILMKLLYYDDVTPLEYEPPFFRGCSEEEAYNTWRKNPLKMVVGNVNSKHLILALKVKSVLDPCGDDNDDSQDGEVSLGADSIQKDGYSDSDSEINQSVDDQYIIAPIDQQQGIDKGIVDDDDTQDSVEDGQQMTRVKDWITGHHLSTLRLLDILSNFPDISVVSTKEIMEKLEEEGVVSRKGQDTYTVNNKKPSHYDFTDIKEENDTQMRSGDKTHMLDDHMYMKALYYALPMEYVTIPKLREKLKGEAAQSAVKKLINRMVKEGLVEAKATTRLGKRVLHSKLTERKLMEAKKALENTATDDDPNHRLPSKSSGRESRTKGSNYHDLSTCGALLSIGSDLTRTKVGSDHHQNESFQIKQTDARTRDINGTPMSIAKTVDSRESFIPGNQNECPDGVVVPCEAMDIVTFTGSTQEKRSRKTSLVKDPILQYKRRKTEAI
ncbi:hypothetical protein MLD38_003345 [Melastoma candidum]|uniref:Uncharacterized protein n=1 Tax=Melastoma candidum TaxID=119954 RepID=A0ACB9S237_9MYRT|nr:hypothetical protein MLD38_003345 [Melastoma candidum]